MGLEAITNFLSNMKTEMLVPGQFYHLGPLNLSDPLRISDHYFHIGNIHSLI